MERAKHKMLTRATYHLNVGIVNMKCPSNKRLSSGDCWDGGGSGIGQLVTTSDTRRTRKTGCRNQQPAGLLASDFNCKLPEYPGLLYSILKRSIVGGRSIKLFNGVGYTIFPLMQISSS